MLLSYVQENSDPKDWRGLPRITEPEYLSLTSGIWNKLVICFPGIGISNPACLKVAPLDSACIHHFAWVSSKRPQRSIFLYTLYMKKLRFREVETYPGSHFTQRKKQCVVDPRCIWAWAALCLTLGAVLWRDHTGTVFYGLWGFSVI